MAKDLGPRRLKAQDAEFVYRQKCCPRTSALDFLTYGTVQLLPDCSSGEQYHHDEEALLFNMRSRFAVTIGSERFELSHYDTLYVPLGTPYEIENTGDDVGELVLCRAIAENRHVPFHSSWEAFRANEERIRHLDGKDVFLMFDVSEAADKLIAGYTLYEPHTRAYPPHNHTDQEEIYIFTQGKGAMEVYLDEKSKTFVTSVDQMDAVTIPLHYYHPVFSQEEPLHFIWCIAGERYWVGDKNKAFMDATVDQLTT